MLPNSQYVTRCHDLPSSVLEWILRCIRPLSLGSQPILDSFIHSVICWVVQKLTRLHRIIVMSATSAVIVGDICVQTVCKACASKAVHDWPVTLLSWLAAAHTMMTMPHEHSQVQKSPAAVWFTISKNGALSKSMYHAENCLRKLCFALSTFVWNAYWHLTSLLVLVDHPGKFSPTHSRNRVANGASGCSRSSEYGLSLRVPAAIPGTSPPWYFKNHYIITCQKVTSMTWQWGMCLHKMLEALKVRCVHCNLWNVCIHVSCLLGALQQ